MFRIRLIIGLILLNMSSYGQCPVPAGLFTETITNSAATLNWSAVTADSFLVRYNEDGVKTLSFRWVAATNYPQVRLTGLKPNTTYFWKVQAKCGNRTGALQAAPMIFTTSAEDDSCQVPNLLALTAVTDSSATLSWNSHILSDSFVVRSRPFGTVIFRYDTLRGTSNSKTLRSLIPSTVYEWSVASLCAGNQRTFSSRSIFTTLATGCGVPGGLKDTAYATNFVVRWRPVAGVTAYTVRYAVHGSGNFLNSTVNDTTVNISQLTPGVTYDVQVRANCGAGTSAWTSSRSITIPRPSTYVTRGPYLQLATEHSVCIRWRTNTPTDSRVRFGTIVNHLTSWTGDTANTTEHLVTLTGLSPATRYYYSVGNSSATLLNDTGCYFRTHPPLGSVEPIHIWATGDMGTGALEQMKVRDAYADYCRSNGIHTNLWIWLGDNAYQSGLDSEFQDNVFSIYPEQFRKWVCWPATGNHDLISSDAAAQTGAYFENFTLPKRGEAGGIPSGTEAYYSYNYANAHFIVLESTDAGFRDTAGAQMAWLRRDLASNKQRWTVVYFHHPPYSKGSHDSDTESELMEMRTNFVPVFEQYKVDLVLCGHSHAYERSFLLQGHYGDENTFNKPLMAVDSGAGIPPYSYRRSAPDFRGVVYTVCGVSGKLSSTTSGWPHNAMYSSSNDFMGSLAIDILGDRLDCKFLTLTGNVYDRFSIEKYGPSHMEPEPASDFQARSIGITNDVIIYPNPVDNSTAVLLYLDSESEVALEIFDIIGRKYGASSIHLPAGSHELPLPVPSSRLAPGTYLLSIVYGGVRTVHSFVVQ